MMAVQGVVKIVPVAPAVLILLASVIGPACGGGVARPSRVDMTGTWNGTSSYPNSPFRLSLMQTDGILRGEYTDGLDRSLAVTGTFSSPAFAIVVDFGDAKLNLTGRLVNPRTAEGDMFTSALGNRLYPFTMVR
jgi:hypothetical protein